MKKFNVFFRQIEQFYMRKLSDRDDSHDKYRLRSLAGTKIDQPYWFLYIGIFLGFFLAGGIYLGLLLHYDQ